MDEIFILENSISDIEYYVGLILSEKQTQKISQVFFNYGEDILKYATTETLNRDYDEQFENSEHLTNYFCKVAKEKFEGENK